MELHGYDAALVVDAYEGAEDGVKGYPRDNEGADGTVGAGEMGAGEEERDGGEEEAGFLVGDE